MEDHRAFDRYAIWFPVTVGSASGTVWAVCEDASAGGVRISGAAGLEVGAHVSVTFRVAAQGDTERTVQGRIVRTEPKDDDPRSVWAYRMAIAFDEPIPELESALKRVSTRPPPAMNEEAG